MATTIKKGNADMSAQKIGRYTVDRVTELEFPAFIATKFFPTVTPEMVEEARRALPDRIDATGRIIMSFHSFVLRTEHHTIIIDTCCSKSRPTREQFDRGKRDYLMELTRLSISPEDVTHVMCAHLHWDHVGWNTRRVNGEWLPTFPNAKYVMAKREYEYWDGFYARKKSTMENVHAMAFEDSVLPVVRAERAVLVEDDFELDKGVTLEPCHGHTPGHVVINVVSDAEKGVFIGDAVHHPMQLLFPELSSWADSDMGISCVSRQGLLEKHADTNNLIMPAHFSTPTCGLIKRVGGRFSFEFVKGS
jgi:glyoxylase-like metal-dependent hydrolase (beta-lactamase superfamily II)